MVIALVGVSLFAAALLAVLARMAWLMLVAKTTALEEKNAELKERVKELETGLTNGKRWTHKETLDIENTQAAFSAIRRELIILSDRVENAMSHLGKLRGSRNGDDVAK